jgi:cell division protein ZapA (FtsZ GTPase activity inhibitor)
MTDKETQVKIKGRALNISVDGLGPLEISHIAGLVEKKINKLEASTQIPDTSKLLLLAAFEFATEHYNLKQKYESSAEADSRKIEELSGKLENVLDKELF